MATPTPTPTPSPTPTPTTDPENYRAIVANGDSLSSGFKLGLGRCAALRSPSALTSTSAKMLFWGSVDGVTYSPIYNAGSQYVEAGLSTSEARWFVLDRDTVFPFTWIKFQIVAADGSTAVAQGANRVFTVLIDAVL